MWPVEEASSLDRHRNQRGGLDLGTDRVVLTGGSSGDQPILRCLLTMRFDPASQEIGVELIRERYCGNRYPGL